MEDVEEAPTTAPLRPGDLVPENPHPHRRPLPRATSQGLFRAP